MRWLHSGQRGARAFERRRGQRNIVLKARQMGLTTWAAARFFLKTITQPGTLTLEVAHTQEVGGGDLPHRAPFSGLAAGASCGRAAEDFAGQRAADCVSGDRFAVPGGLGGRPKCRARADGAEPALLGAGALAGRSGGDSGGTAGGDGAGSAR